MAAEPAPRLRALPSISIEEALTQEVADLHAQLRGAQTEIAAWRSRYAALEERVDEEDRADSLWEVGQRLFVYQCRASGHVTSTGKPSCRWSTKRFKMVRRRLKEPDGLRECLRAIAGNMADTWRVKNGLTMWEDVFSTQEKFERALSRCPATWTPPPGAEVLLGA